MAKIERKLLAHFLDAAAPGATPAEPVYVRLGKDLEEYSAELSATVDKKKNILGETTVLLSSYEKSGTVEPYYAEKGDPLFERLQEIADSMLVLDDCNSTLVDVHLWETATADAYPAVRWDVVIEVSSTGGDSTGYQIPFNVHYTGVRTVGTFDTKTRKFTPAAEAAPENTQVMAMSEPAPAQTKSAKKD